MSENLRAIDSSTSESGYREPISPELVLVDPELRRAVLARMLQEEAAMAALAERAAVAAPPVPPAPPPAPPQRRAEPVPAAPARRPPRIGSRLGKALRTSAAVPGLVGLSIFLALGVSEARVSEPTLGPAPAKTATSASSTQTKSKLPVQAPRPARRAAPTRPAASGRSSAEVERDVLTRIVRSPAGKIPRALIDPATGLAKNNLQATCRQTAPGTFVCLVRPVAHRAGEGLTVRYRRIGGGDAALTWGRYRRG